MSMAGELRLGVDLSSSRIRAVVGFADATAAVLPLQEVGWLANTVLVTGDGTLLVGRDAERHDRAGPGGAWVAEPGSRLGDDVVVDGRRVEAVDLVAALLRSVAACAASVVGSTPRLVTVAVPAGWGPRRVAGLRRAAQAAGLGRVEVVIAPVAVAWHLVCGGAVSRYGATVLVCEVDAAGATSTAPAATTATATVLRRTVSGFDVVSCVDTATVVADLDTASPGSRRSGGSSDDTTVAPDVAAGQRPGRYTDDVPPPVSATRTSGEAGDNDLADARVGEVVRRAVDGAGVAAGGLTLVCAAGAGAHEVPVGTQLRAVTDVEPFLVVEAELAVALGAVRSPPPSTGPATTRPVSGAVLAPGQQGQVRDAAAVGWRDLVAALVPAMWSLVLFGQFMAGSERYGPRQSIERGMLLASWGGLAFAATFGLIAAVSGFALVTAARHEEGTAAVWVRHRLLAVALAGGGVGGLVVAAVYAMVAAGYFDLESGPLLRWSVLPVLPGVVAVLALAVVVWRRPDPPRGSWLGWLRFPPSVAAFVGFGAWLISFDEQGSPVVLKVLAWQLRQWVAESPDDIVGPVGRLGGLCVGAGLGLLLVRRLLHRLLLAVPLAGLIAASLGWRTTGMVAVGFSLAVAGWWGARTVWLLLRRLLLVPPADVPSPRTPAARDATGVASRGTSGIGAGQVGPAGRAGPSRAWTSDVSGS
ncbi:hypothetical protein AB0H83_35005 [Dactylosporangium sp. NPDC050688]|uniref:hypothetical protein n=1 Tax=Dactylosporangium sp. NPDC050688 TaxID=3157217 RepID=UPI0033D1AB84